MKCNLSTLSFIPFCTMKRSVHEHSPLGIVQEVLRTEVPSHQLPGLHRAICKVLEATYGQHAASHAAELARHALLGSDQAAALHWSLLAGKDAAQQLAYREAIGHFQLVLKLLI